MNIPPDRIGFDFDGVIADIGEALIRMACEQYGFCSFTLEDITSFQVEQCVPVPYNIIDKIFTDILDDSLATRLKPLPGAIEVITEISRVCPATIITARPQENPVHAWLDAFFPSKVKKRITLVAMGDHDDKVRYARHHDLSYFIDDRLETCRQMNIAGIYPFLFSQPWNRKSSLPSVANWEEIRTLIDFNGTTHSTSNYQS